MSNLIRDVAEERGRLILIGEAKRKPEGESKQDVRARWLIVWERKKIQSSTAVWASPPPRLVAYGVKNQEVPRRA